VVYEWWGSLDVPKSFWRQLRANGVDVRVINPPGVGAPLEVINRDHRKSIGVDGVYASVGGVCIADEWLARSPVTHLPYRDTAVSVRGPVVADIERAFAGVWAAAGAPLPPDEIPVVSAQAVGSASARLIAEEPGRMRMLQVFQSVLAGVEKRVWLADAYFLAAPLLRAAIMQAARDGVDVRILLPASNDLPVVAALSRSGYRPLLEAGVRIWEYAGLMMHAKTTVADGWWARIGSTNLNVTGLLTNWEIDLVAEDVTFGAAMEEMYLDDLHHAREIRLENGKQRLRPRPTRPESIAERQAEREGQRQRRMFTPEGRARTGAAVARVSAAAFGAGDALQRHERGVGAVIGGAMVGLSLLVARFPRVLAWPVAALAGMFGAASLIRAARGNPGASRPAPTAPVRLFSRRPPRLIMRRRRAKRTED
jgi:cardiolipin synthase